MTRCSAPPFFGLAAGVAVPGASSGGRSRGGPEGYTARPRSKAKNPPGRRAVQRGSGTITFPPPGWRPRCQPSRTRTPRPGTLPGHASQRAGKSTDGRAAGGHFSYNASPHPLQGCRPRRRGPAHAVTRTRQEGARRSYQAVAEAHAQQVGVLRYWTVEVQRNVTARTRATAAYERVLWEGEPSAQRTAL